LADECIEGVTPEIPLGERFWPLSPREQRAIHEMFSAREVRRLITCLQDRDEGDKVKVMDAAYWMKGCSSLRPTICRSRQDWKEKAQEREVLFNCY
jgi:hypothetical protein